MTEQQKQAIQKAQEAVVAALNSGADLTNSWRA